MKALPFKLVSERIDTVTSADQIYAMVAEAMGGPAQVAGWSFDRKAEYPYLQKLARDKPDALAAAIFGVFHHFLAIQRHPRSFLLDSFLMKRAAADALAETFSPAPRKPAKKMRVAMMVPWLAGNPNNNMLRVAAGYLAGLLRHPDVADAALVVTNESSLAADTAVQDGRIDSGVRRAAHEAVMKEHGIAGGKLHYAPPPFTGQGNSAWQFDFFGKFKPDVVFVPNVEMTSGHIHAFGKSAATVYLQTSVRNRPPYDFDRYLYLGEKREIDSTHIHPERWFYHSFGYANFGVGPGLSRAELGLTDDHFLMITVGNRLEAELTPAFAALVNRVAEGRDDVALLVLGVRDEAAVRKNLGPLVATLGERLIFKGFAQNIGDYLAAADVYVNPKRTGGAVSMALSVYAGTPILSFTHNDANTFIVGEMICESEEEYEQRLAYMSRNRNFLKAIEKVQRQRFERGHTEDASAANLVAHFKAVLEARAKA